MQLDMHYYGTYALARAAGISEENAKIIATAAQFVDDNAENDSVLIKDGARLDVEATAHHAADTKNIDMADQRQIWVPFHFLSGIKGADYASRLICRKPGTSKTIEQLLSYSLSRLNKPYALTLLGITAHIYADTFSHYGFSGVSSPKNRVRNNSILFHGSDEKTEKYLRNKAKEFRKKYPREGGGLAKIKSLAAETLSGALGHGAVITYPDLPYLKWRFTYQGAKKPTIRDNPKTFMEGCQALYDFFLTASKKQPALAAGGRKKFATIQPTVADILKVQGGKTTRIEAWQQAALAGSLYDAEMRIPIYDPKGWYYQRTLMENLRNSTVIKNKPVFQFYQAAAHLRTYILRDLLPSHGLIVA